MTKSAPDTKHPGSVLSYTFGFVSAIALSVGAYWLVVNEVYSGAALIAAITAMAIAQLIIQLVCFLHLGNEPKPRWNLAVFLFMILIMTIVVGGSLWIMHNLNYNMMMTPEEMETFMLEQNKKGF